MGKTRAGLRYVPQDAHYKEAKQRGFVARSALKLEEIDKKLKLYSRGMRVLDLGCAPGSWLQYAARRVGPEGRLLGIDLDPVRVDLKSVETIVGDLLTLRVEDARLQSYLPFDLIQSDAMVKTSGIAESDCARSVALVEHGLSLAHAGALKPGGNFIAKVFEGPGFTPFYVAFKRDFKRCSVNKPEAIRKGSREVYVVGLDFRGPKNTPKNTLKNTSSPGSSAE
jgi:23S rRNA (uridine2552-2'-O)-methyltransferase